MHIMKKIYVYLSLTIAAAVWSCEEKENLDPVGNWELAVPVLSTPTENASIVLNEASPSSAAAKFEWQPAAASNRFVVAYTFQLIPENGAEPIFTMASSNSGKDLFVAPTAQQIDYALWAACYPAGATANLKWNVVARAIEKTTESSQKVSIKRFDTEYIPTTLFLTGEATEVGADVANATEMRARKDADGNETGIFDVYTTLTQGKTYNFHDQANILSRKIGGSDGTLSCGTTITAPETAQYRVTVDFNTNTYELSKIDAIVIAGDAVEGSWGATIPLAYKGNGIWQSDVEFINIADFVFQANSWAYIFKRIEGRWKPDNTEGEILLEAEQGEAGVVVQNLVAPGTGVHTVTLDLSTSGYKFSLISLNPAKAIFGETKNPAADKVSGNFTFGQYAIPGQLFLLSGNELVAEFTKDNKVFRSVKYLALEASKKYTLNSAADGSGTTYNNIGDGSIAVDHDQAYQVNVDFETGKLAWQYYNFKLFHWDDDATGGWDAKVETPMTYVHPYTYEATAALTSNFELKFNSPWDIEFGTAGTALTGTMTKGGPNFKGIAQSGTYHATIVVADDYQSAEYSLVKQ
jgi:hypothetical protein